MPLSSSLKHDLACLDTRAYFPRRWSEEVLRSYHRVSHSLKGSDGDRLRKLHDWVMVPLTLWPVEMCDALRDALAAWKDTKALTEPQRLLVDLLPEPPDAAACEIVAQHEREVQRGFYEHVTGESAKYAQMEAHCFAAEGVADGGEHRWHRALLATGDYLLGNGSHLLWNKRSEAFNWKRLLRGQKDEVQQSDHLKQLIDGVRCDCPLLDQLEVTIKEALERSDLEEWRRLMIQWPEIIGFCKERRVSREGGTVYLLQRSDYRGRWAEIWSFALHLELEKEIVQLHPFQEAVYHMARGYDPCARVVWRTERFGNVALTVEREGERAKLTLLRWHGEPLDPILVQLIEATGFRPAEHGRYECLHERNEAKKRVQEVAVVLRRFLEEKSAGASGEHMIQSTTAKSPF